MNNHRFTAERIQALDSILSGTASNEYRVRQIAVALECGSFDFAPPSIQMEMVDVAMACYFGRADWLNANRRVS